MSPYPKKEINTLKARNKVNVRKINIEAQEDGSVLRQ